MTRQQAIDKVLSWLQYKPPRGDKLVIDCGQLGSLIVVGRQQRQGIDNVQQWKVAWADSTAQLDDLEQLQIKPPVQQQGYECEFCGKLFEKKFARTNHQRACKNK